MAQIAKGDPVRLTEMQKMSVKEWLVLLENYITNMKHPDGNDTDGI